MCRLQSACYCLPSQPFLINPYIGVLAWELQPLAKHPPWGQSMAVQFVTRLTFTVSSCCKVAVRRQHTRTWCIWVDLGSVKGLSTGACAHHHAWIWVVPWWQSFIPYVMVMMGGGGFNFYPQQWTRITFSFVLVTVSKASDYFIWMGCALPRLYGYLFVSFKAKYKIHLITPNFWAICGINVFCNLQSKFFPPVTNIGSCL